MFKAKVHRLHPNSTATKTAHGWEVRAGADILGQGGSAAAAWYDASLSCFPAPSAAAPLSLAAVPHTVSATRSAKVPVPTWPFPCSTRPELQAEHDAYCAALGTAGTPRTDRSF